MSELILIPSLLEMNYLRHESATELSGDFPAWSQASHIFAVCGIGPAAAALSTSLLIARFQPQRVILAGIAGAYAQSGLAVGDVVQGSQEIFADLGYQTDEAFVNLDQMNLPMLPTHRGDLKCTQVLDTFPKLAAARDFLTVSAVTNSNRVADKLWNTYGAVLENMEGAAVAMACRFHQVPCFELRAISNLVGPRDPKAWKIDEAMLNLKQVLFDQLKH